MWPSKHQYIPLGENAGEDKVIISPAKRTKKWTIPGLVLLNLVLAVLLAASVFSNYHGDIHESVPAEFGKFKAQALYKSLFLFVHSNSTGRGSSHQMDKIPLVD